MRTLTLHAADELAQRWKRRASDLDRAAKSRGSDDRLARHLAALDRERAQGYRVCAAELHALVAVTMEMEAAQHGDPEPRTGAYGAPIPPGDCGAYWADEGGEWMCHRPKGHEGDHRHHDLPLDVILRLFLPPEPDPNALLDWSQGRRP